MHYFVHLISLVTCQYHVYTDITEVRSCYSIQQKSWVTNRKGTTAPKTTRSAYRSYNANVPLGTIKHAEETITCATAWKFCVVERNVQRWRKKKELLLKEATSPQNAFCWPKQRNLSAPDIVLGSVLGGGGGIVLSEWQYRWRHWRVLCP